MMQAIAAGKWQEGLSTYELTLDNTPTNKASASYECDNDDLDIILLVCRLLTMLS